MTQPATTGLTGMLMQWLLQLAQSPYSWMPIQQQQCMVGRLVDRQELAYEMTISNMYSHGMHCPWQPHTCSISSGKGRVVDQVQHKNCTKILQVEESWSNYKMCVTYFLQEFTLYSAFFILFVCGV
jgi:hypothetical protein